MFSHNDNFLYFFFSLQFFFELKLQFEIFAIDLNGLVLMNLKTKEIYYSIFLKIENFYCYYSTNSSPGHLVWIVKLFIKSRKLKKKKFLKFKLLHFINSILIKLQFEKKERKIVHNYFLYFFLQKFIFESIKK